MQSLEQWPIERLREYEKNPRKNDHAVEPLAKAIAEFGFRVPILAKSDGMIIDGHLRLKAAQHLGMETVPVLLADDMSAAQVKAFRLAVNRMAELAEWDISLLSSEIRLLSDMGFDLDILGFPASDLADFLSPGQAAAGDVGGGTAGNLADKFGAPPFSVLNARGGWWQDRKRAWLALGIKSEVGRGVAEDGDSDATLGKDATAEIASQSALNAYRKPNATPGGSAMPATDYKKSGAPGTGSGKAIAGTRKANAVPGGAPMPLDRAKNRKAAARGA